MDLVSKLYWPWWNQKFRFVINKGQDFQMFDSRQHGECEKQYGFSARSFPSPSINNNFLRIIFEFICFQPHFLPSSIHSSMSWCTLTTACPLSVHTWTNICGGRNIWPSFNWWDKQHLHEITDTLAGGRNWHRLRDLIYRHLTSSFRFRFNLAAPWFWASTVFALTANSHCGCSTRFAGTWCPSW